MYVMYMRVCPHVGTLIHAEIKLKPQSGLEVKENWLHYTACIKCSNTTKAILQPANSNQKPKGIGSHCCHLCHLSKAQLRMLSETASCLLQGATLHMVLLPANA